MAERCSIVAYLLRYMLLDLLGLISRFFTERAQSDEKYDNS